MCVLSLSRTGFYYANKVMQTIQIWTVNEEELPLLATWFLPPPWVCGAPFLDGSDKINQKSLISIFLIFKCVPYIKYFVYSLPDLCPSFLLTYSKTWADRPLLWWWGSFHQVWAGPGLLVPSGTPPLWCCLHPSPPSLLWTLAWVGNKCLSCLYRCLL